MLMSQNIIWSIKFLIAGGAQHLHRHYYDAEFLEVLQTDTTLVTLLRKKSKTDTYVGQQGDEAHEVKTCTKVGLKDRVDDESDEKRTIFAKAELPQRESAVAHVKCGCFFRCVVDNTVRIVFLKSIVVDGDMSQIRDQNLSTNKTSFVCTGDVTFLVVVMAPAPSGGLDFDVLTWPGDVNDPATAVSIPVSDWVGPAHVIPLCDGALQKKSLCPVALTDGTPEGCKGCCFGIGGLTAHTLPRVFVVNKYFVK